MLQTNDQMLSLYRSASKSLSELLNVVLANTERIQNSQLNATKELLSSHASTGQEIDAAHSLHEMLDIQSKLAREQWTMSLSCLGDVYAASSLNQMEIIRQAQSQALQIFDGLNETLDGIPLETAPFLSPMKMMIGAARVGCAANIRATEEAALMAASRIEGIEGDVRKPPGKRQTA